MYAGQCKQMTRARSGFAMPRKAGLDFLWPVTSDKTRTPAFGVGKSGQRKGQCGLWTPMEMSTSPFEQRGIECHAQTSKQHGINDAC